MWSQGLVRLVENICLGHILSPFGPLEGTPPQRNQMLSNTLARNSTCCGHLVLQGLPLKKHGGMHVMLNSLMGLLHGPQSFQEINVVETNQTTKGCLTLWPMGCDNEIARVLETHLKTISWKFDNTYCAVMGLQVQCNNIYIWPSFNMNALSL